jgi:hypothetical protein
LLVIHSLVVSTSISQPSCRLMVPMLVSVSSRLSIGRLVLLIRGCDSHRAPLQTSRCRVHLLHHVGREAYSLRPLCRSGRLFTRMKRGTTNYPEGYRADARAIWRFPHVEPVACYHLSGGAARIRGAECSGASPDEIGGRRQQNQSSWHDHRQDRRVAGRSNRRHKGYARQR